MSRFAGFWDKDIAWHWLPKHDEAVQEIKLMITDTPVLKYYDIDKPMTIQKRCQQERPGLLSAAAGTTCGFCLSGTHANRTKLCPKAESSVKIAKSLCKRAKLDGTDPWLAIQHWQNTPTDGLDSSPAQRLMSRRLRMGLLTANSLLFPKIVEGVSEKRR